MLLWKLLSRTMLDAPTDGSGGGEQIPPNPDPNPTPDPGKTFTQAELDAIIDTRLKRERKKMADDAAEAAKNASLTETEKEKKRAEAAEKALKDTQTASDQRIVRTEAKVALIEAGAKADRVADLVKLADLSSVTVDETTGEVDSVLLKKAVTSILEKYPEFKAGTQQQRSGGDFNGGQAGDKPLSEAVLMEMPPEEYTRRLPEIKAYYNTKK